MKYEIIVNNSKVYEMKGKQTYFVFYYAKICICVCVIYYMC